MGLKSMKWALLAGTALAAPAQAQEITYWMWDGNQAPVYQQCADAFTAQNPGITVKITQDGWDNYWTTLTTGFVSGTAPDVFVNHVSRYPEFLVNGVMEDLTDRISADGYDMSGFLPGLAQTWNKDEKQWGMPKDWDTVAIVYNADKLAEAGLTPADLENLTWNPQDGGTWEQTIAKLTIDKNGKRGNEEGFDKANVASYGYVSSPLSALGQTEWSYLAVANGFKYIDQAWGTKYFIDDAKLAEAINWLQDLSLDKGLMPTQEMAGKLGASALFTAGQGAMATDGSWMIGSYLDNSKFNIGFAPLPAGPEGRKSMFNGLADSIWAGSPNKDAAWQWVKFLGSSECQSIVGKASVVFPARPEAVELAIEAHKARGVDVSAFTKLAVAESTFSFPMTERGNEVDSILKTALDKVMLGQGEPAEILPAANAEINALFQ
jgi:multiple sugar transport system substrate-binding protein